MTKDEIKEANSVEDVLRRYGVQVVRGRCRAICHDGQKLTAKVSRDAYYCFKCNKSMDVFDITMHFNDCDFKTAFELLGGKEKPSLRTRVAAINAQRARRLETQRKQKLNDDFTNTRRLMFEYKRLLALTDEYTEQWTKYYNTIQLLEYKLDAILGDM